MKTRTFLILGILMTSAMFALSFYELHTRRQAEANTVVIPQVAIRAEEHIAEKEAHFRSIPLPLSTENLAVGAEAVVPDWEWVTVLNESPVRVVYSNGTGELVSGDTCGIEFGGTVRVSEIRTSDLLVEYTAPGNPKGTRCPSEVRFTLPIQEFLSLSQRYETEVNRITSEKSLVSILLADEHYGEPFGAPEEWVDVVNIAPLRQNFANGFDYLSFGDSCITAKAGVVTERGTTEDGRILYEYNTVPDGLMGTSCPNGILFFSEREITG